MLGLWKESWNIPRCVKSDRIPHWLIIIWDHSTWSYHAPWLASPTPSWSSSNRTSFSVHSMRLSCPYIPPSSRRGEKRPSRTTHRRSLAQERLWNQVAKQVIGTLRRRGSTTGFWRSTTTTLSISICDAWIKSSKLWQTSWEPELLINVDHTIKKCRRSIKTSTTSFTTSVWTIIVLLLFRSSVASSATSAYPLSMVSSARTSWKYTFIRRRSNNRLDSLPQFLRNTALNLTVQSGTQTLGNTTSTSPWSCSWTCRTNNLI